MSAPDRVPTSPTQTKHYSSPPRRDGSWRAGRPGETIGAPFPTGLALGNQGPDQGYVLKLAEAFRGRLVLTPVEHSADAIAGAAAVALRRASLYGRGPVRDDVELGLRVYGFLDEAPTELVKFRRRLFAEVHHTAVHYFAAREIAGRVRDDLLRLPTQQAFVELAADWRRAFHLED
jgi:hypothetical protein